MARLEDPLTERLDDAGLNPSEEERIASPSRDTAAHRFEDVYQANFAALLAYALRRVAAPGDAADVVAETFLVAWRRVDQMPEGSEATPWLYAVARRILANHHRAGLRRTRLGDRLRSELDHIPVDFPNGDDGPVMGALQRLPGDDREMLMLTCWEGLSPSEAAQVLGLTPSAARKRLSRARKRMRKQLEGTINQAGRRND